MKTGWGGRLADVINSLNGNAQLSMSISLAHNNFFLVGGSILPYSVSSHGVDKLGYYNETWDNPGTNITKAFLAADYNNLFEKTYSGIFRRAIDTSQRLSGILETAPTINTVFPAGNELADQLKMIARLISVRNQLGLRRQIFFCALWDFDTHGEQLDAHAELLRKVSQATHAFYQATVELGVADQVTTFTSSDFGRTYLSNGKGSDHGWGGHQFVMGNAVRGGDIYGTIPVLRVDGPDDIGQGRWIPTIATDEYAATLAQWFGVSSSAFRQCCPTSIVSRARIWALWDETLFDRYFLTNEPKVSWSF